MKIEPHPPHSSGSSDVEGKSRDLSTKNSGLQHFFTHFGSFFRFEVGLGSAAWIWMPFLLLWAVFDAPQVIQAGEFRWTRIRPTLEVPLLVALWLLSGPRWFASPWLRRPLRGLIAFVAAVLFLYGVDGVVWRYLMRTQPVLYDQAVMIRHTLVLIGDLWSLDLVLRGLAGLAMVVVVLLLIRGLLIRLESTISLQAHRTSRIGLGLVVVLCFVAGEVPKAKGQIRGKWQSVSLRKNLEKSERMHARLKKSLKRSKYRGYKKIKLTSRPRVELFFVESYGRLLAADPALRSKWHEWLAELHEGAAAGGLVAASSYSRAPVSGGRSWVAEGSVIMGARVKYEVVFRNLIEEIDKIPHLVGFFEDQGYETVLLAPADRVRLGLENENRYSYDRTVTFDDLDYQGKHIGWGRIPDHYSLWRTKSHVLDKSLDPVFLNFHMVSSHAPWKEVPPLSAVLDSVPESSTANHSPEDESVRALELSKRFRRLRRDKDHRFAYHGKLDQLGRDAYARAIRYELKLIEEYLRLPVGDRLVIVMGDHQPPVVAPENASFDVPIHVFASRKEILHEFLDYGFQPGLIPDSADRIHHAGLFSLIVRSLASCCSETKKLPKVRRRGVALGG